VVLVRALYWIAQWWFILLIRLICGPNMYNRIVTSNCNLSSIGRTDCCLRIRLFVVLTRRRCDVVVVQLIVSNITEGCNLSSLLWYYCPSSIVDVSPPHHNCSHHHCHIILYHSTPDIVVSSSVSYSSSLFDCCVIIICSVVVVGVAVEVHSSSICAWVCTSQRLLPTS